MTRGDEAGGLTGSGMAPLARMAIHVQPGQIMRRARLHAQRNALRRWPEVGRRLCAGPDPAAAVGWPADFRPVDAQTPGRWPTLPALRVGRIGLLGSNEHLGNPPDWSHADAPLLWRFHLHYWDWAWGLAADPDRDGARTTFARLWQSWREATTFGSGEGWHPYPAALRAWSWCGLHRDLVAGSGIERSYVGELAVHTGFLRRHLETDLRGNHLIKDLKALVGLAVFFADERLLRQALRRLIGQLAQQILADGGHYERSPAYHCQVLADLIDVAGLIAASGRADVSKIVETIARMRLWLGNVLGPGGTLPMLNDGYPQADGLLAVLRPEVRQETRLHLLAGTGLVRVSVGRWWLLADVGGPCPDGLSGHAHADALSCLLYADGAPVLVDTGTSTYEPGPVRRYERSTAAHSTVQVDGADSTEVWGVFRVARRARVSGLAARPGSSGFTCEAVHDGFRRLPGRPLHHRRWSLTEDELRVDDLITGRGRHEIVVRWHLAVGSAVRLVGGTAQVTARAGAFRMAVEATGPVLLSTQIRQVAAGFGRTADAPVLACRMDASLPVRVSTVWTRTRGHAGGKDPI